MGTHQLPQKLPYFVFGFIYDINDVCMAGVYVCVYVFTP